jgi:hypothetical protein
MAGRPEPVGVAAFGVATTEVSPAGAPAVEVGVAVLAPAPSSPPTVIVPTMPVA